MFLAIQNWLWHIIFRLGASLVIKKVNFFCETDYRIRFTFLWNGIRIPFHKYFKFFVKQNTNSVSEKCETDSVIRFTKKKLKILWNRLQNPFHIFLKRNSYSVSRKIWNICGTEYKFRFIKMWNGFCNPFQKKKNSFFWNQRCFQP